MATAAYLSPPQKFQVHKITYDMSFLKRFSTRKSQNPITNPTDGHLATVHSKVAMAANNDAPPAYSAVPATHPSNMTAADSPYEFLSQFDTVFVIDDSGSMAGRNWRETGDALSAITPKCTEHDADGIDIYFLNHRNPYDSGILGGYSNVTTTASVQEIFRMVQPSGGTPTGTRLNAIIRNYMSDLPKALQKQAKGQGARVKPLNIIVITDGAATDDVESTIVSAAKKLDNMGAEPWQIGIQFFQVGQDQAAAADLRDLDDALAGEHGVRDMVDTVPWDGVNGFALTAEGIMKVTMGAINRKLDRKKAGGGR